MNRTRLAPSRAPRLRWVLLLVALDAATAVAQTGPPYPVKPVRFVVGQAPGGATDLVARAVAHKLTELMGQTVIVENRTGAAGSIGAASVAKSAPDGYTLLVVSSSYSINPGLYANLPFDPVKDLLPVTLLAQAPFLLVVHPSLPARTVGDLVALAKSKPDSLNFASGGLGSSGQLAGELFKNLAGVKLTHVPYKGAGPALVDVIAGQVHLTFASVISSLGHVKSGKLRALAVTSAGRSKALPGLVTVAEAGIKGYATTTWYGVLAPTGTRPTVIARLNSELRKSVQSPEVYQRLSGDGAEPVGGTPEHFQEHLAAEMAKWRKLIREAGIRAD
jgi:tripartite-type tricarboxylate transporter receptor subunit TctC